MSKKNLCLCVNHLVRKIYLTSNAPRNLSVKAVIFKMKFQYFSQILTKVHHCCAQYYFKGGHLPSVCIAVVHFIEIICCNTEVTNILIVFENQIVSSQPKAIAGSDTLVKRNVYTILLSNTEITFVTSVLHQMILVKFTAAMHTG